MKSSKLKNVVSFLVFAGPAVTVFFLVIILAFINGIQLTFTDWNGLSDTYQYIGFRNYVDAFADTAFWTSLVAHISSMSSAWSSLRTSSHFSSLIS